MLVDMLLGLMFNTLNAFRKLALISILAFSPSTRMSGRPNDFARFRSISRYPGREKCYGPLPGGGMKAAACVPELSAIAFA